MSTEPGRASPAPAPAPSAPAQRYTLNGATMGTRWSVVFFAPVERTWNELALKLQAAVDTVDAQMSTWKPDSDLMRINRAAVGEPVAVSPQLIAVLATAFDIGRRSGGAFDVGVGELVGRWGFGAAAATGPVSAEPGSGTRRPPACDAVAVDFDYGEVTRKVEVALDLSGIAKGFAVDCLAEEMDRAGIGSYLVSIDGELRARGRKPGGESWTVAVEKPERDRRQVAAVIGLEDASVATSGDYRHWREQDGRSWSHTIDPRTGRPCENDLASVTVMAGSCMEADAWATAFMVLGREAGQSLADQLGLEAMFMTREPPA